MTHSLQLSHFSAALIFAALVSIVFGITQRNERRQMLLYGAKCFGLFFGGLIVAGWLMWALRH